MQEEKDIFYSKQIFANIVLLARKWEVHYNRCHIKDDLTLKQMMLLIVASHVFENDPTVKDLSNHLSSSHQNIKALLQQLEKKEYVKLYKDQCDKRITRVNVLKRNRDEDVIRNLKDHKLLKELFANISLDDLVITLKTIEKLNDTASSVLEF